jgi:DNA helicase HerA-like ATPase
LKTLVESINTGDFEFEFEKSGYIIHWSGITKPIDNYKGNTVYELGNKEICELLEIRETEIEEAPENNSSNLDDNLPAPKPDEPKTPTPSGEVKAEPKGEVKPVDEKPQDEKKEEVKAEQPIIETPITTKPRIILGSNVDNGKDVVFDPITMNPKKLANQHLLIVGKSGAGKSQTTSSVLYELSKQEIPFLILDFQGEYNFKCFD